MGSAIVAREVLVNDDFGENLRGEGVVYGDLQWLIDSSIRARAQAPDLRIIAPAGTVAQHVLSLAAIPFVSKP